MREALLAPSREVVIPTAHGRVVHGTLFGPDAPDAPGGTALLMLCALAAPQRYQAALAGFLGEAGYRVLTFDYRGVGRSLHGGDPTTNLDDWAADVRAAIAFCQERLRCERLLVLGHSVGGMLLGHAGLADGVDGALVIAASQGTPRLYRGRDRLRVEAAYAVLPWVARQLGELPGWSFFLRHPVPRDVVVHWARWGREGFASWDGVSSAASFAAFRGPLLAVQLADDDWVPVQAMDALLTHFSAAGVRRVIYDPSPRGGRLGHFGLFHPQAPPWAREQVLRWIAEVEAAV